MTHLITEKRYGRVSGGVLAALALVLLAGFGVWHLTRATAPKTVAVKDLPKGKVLSVTPSAGYAPELTDAEREILRTGPVESDKDSVRRHALAMAKLQPDPMDRRFLEQYAVANLDGYGVGQPIAERTPQLRSVIDAMRSGKNPERLSAVFAPKPFDPVAYRADPKAYLDIVEPGRVFQAKAPSPETPRIEPLSPYFQEVKQGDAVALSVKATPGYPVTFTSFALGAFAESGMTTVTVQADAAGVATVHFRGVSGTVMESDVLASCPMTSGQARFKLNTLIPMESRRASL